MKKQDAKTSPPVKVVGFRVEGATPSPRDTSLADVGAASTVTGSPSPVIIPPAFAVSCSCCGGGMGVACMQWSTLYMPRLQARLASGGVL